MRSAGCVINDIADRNFDGHVSRTKNRPLASGVLSVKKAFALFALLCFFALILVLQLNLLTIELSSVGLALAVIYPFLKRYTHWPQLILGAAFAWSVPMAFAALTNQVPPIAWWVFLTAVLWPLAYDTMYAMADRQDDLKIGVKSTAILFGNSDRFLIGIMQIVILMLLVYIGIYLQLSMRYFICLLFASCFFIYQQYLIRDRDPARCFRAFNNHWFGAVVFLGIYSSIH
jgi:4-hydroxybenzoate polyprenyltransferase